MARQIANIEVLPHHWQDLPHHITCHITGTESFLLTVITAGRGWNSLVNGSAQELDSVEDANLNTSVSTQQTLTIW